MSLGVLWQVNSATKMAEFPLLGVISLPLTSDSLVAAEYPEEATRKKLRLGRVIGLEYISSSSPSMSKGVGLGDVRRRLAIG